MSRRPVLRRGSAALLAGALLAAAGCGGVRAGDLFLLTRSGSSPQAKLTLLVDEEGGVRCNGHRAAAKLSDAQLVQARGIQEDLRSPASAALALPPRPGSVQSYVVRDENGTVSFADNSAGQPKVLQQLQLFAVQVAQGICHLPQ